MTDKALTCPHCGHSIAIPRHYFAVPDRAIPCPSCDGLSWFPVRARVLATLAMMAVLAVFVLGAKTAGLGAPEGWQDLLILGTLLVAAVATSRYATRSVCRSATDRLVSR